MTLYHPRTSHLTSPLDNPYGLVNKQQSSTFGALIHPNPPTVIAIQACSANGFPHEHRADFAAFQFPTAASPLAGAWPANRVCLHPRKSASFGLPSRSITVHVKKFKLMEGRSHGHSASRPSPSTVRHTTALTRSRVAGYPP